MRLVVNQLRNRNFPKPQTKIQLKPTLTDLLILEPFPSSLLNKPASYLHVSNVNPYLTSTVRSTSLSTHTGTKFPFIMKLCFSSSKSMNGTWATEGNGDKMNGDN